MQVVDETLLCAGLLSDLAANLPTGLVRFYHHRWICIVLESSVRYKAPHSPAQ